MTCKGGRKVLHSTMSFTFPCMLVLHKHSDKGKNQFLEKLRLSPVWTDPLKHESWAGGQICPPLNYGYRSMFSLFSFSQSSFLGCKGSESKSTAIYLRKYSPESFWKNRHFLQNLKKIKNSLFGNQTFCRKKCRQN